MDSDAIFHRDHLQRLFTSLSLKKEEHVRLVVDFIVSRFATVSPHCIFFLAAIVTTPHASEVVAVLLSHLRTYPEIAISGTYGRIN